MDIGTIVAVLFIGVFAILRHWRTPGVESLGAPAVKRARMANPEQLEILKKGATAWNTWRGTTTKNWYSDVEQARISRSSRPSLAELPPWPVFDLSGADLSNLNLTGADLQSAALSSANLHNAVLGGADLRCSNLYAANLSGADLSGADVRGADLTGAVGLTPEQLILAVGDPTTKLSPPLAWPPTWRARKSSFPYPARPLRPMPQESSVLPYRAVFSPDEFERISRGLIPRTMEDKWFIYLDGTTLNLHMSWGDCAYQVEFVGIRSTGIDSNLMGTSAALDDRNYYVARALKNRHPIFQNRSTDASDTTWLDSLIRFFLLGDKTKWPTFRVRWFQRRLSPDDSERRVFLRVGVGCLFLSVGLFVLGAVFGDYNEGRSFLERPITLVTLWGSVLAVCSGMGVLVHRHWWHKK